MTDIKSSHPHIFFANASLQGCGKKAAKLKPPLKFAQVTHGRTAGTVQCLYLSRSGLANHNNLVHDCEIIV